ncbi:hypothetical protein ABZT26_35180 [Streptomyces sp. NPDC005395]|uniref:hypothetical protein n=1 Tax=Streptomyces sp. NPDC005395 TaxID=3157042 RepID=UPI0033BC0602
MPVRLATCSYPEFRPEMGIPVRATLGAPRFSLGYVLGGVMPDATPERWFMGQPYEDFRRRMRHKLHKLTIHRFMERAQAIGDAHGKPDATIVLLCFENGRNKKGWCHRALVAEWLEEQGVPCPEVGTLSPDDETILRQQAGGGEDEPPPFEALELW